MVFGRATCQSARVFSSCVCRQPAAVAAFAISTKDTARATAIEARSYCSSSTSANFATPPHYASDVTGVLASATVMGVVVSKMWWDASSSSITGGSAEVTREDVAHCMVEFTAEVKNLVVRIVVVVSPGR